MDQQTEIQVREATAGDADALAALCGQLGYAVSAAETRKRLANETGRADRTVTVACESGRVVGWLAVQVQSTIESGSWAEITGLVVDQSARRAGVGAALVQWAREWAKARGQDRLRVRSNVIRPEAPPFYQSQGFTQTKQQRIFDAPL
jgi:GNAT superfamily N-acetyltransferase